MGITSFAKTRLRVVGASEWLTGDVELDAGTFLTGAQDDAAKRLTFNGEAQGNPRAVEAFVPGTLAARTVMRANLDDPVVTAIDAYFKTAPSGVGAADHARLRVAGATSGAVEVAFDSAASEWHKTRGDLATALGAINTTLTPATGGAGYRGMGVRIRPTSDLTVAAISTYFAPPPSGQSRGAGPIRVGITEIFNSTSGHTLATTPWLTVDGQPVFGEFDTGEILEPGWNTVELSAPVDLVSGTHYFVVLQNETGDHILNGDSSSGSYTGSINIGTSIAGRPVTVGASAGAWNMEGTFPPGYGMFRLHGDIAGIAIEGLLVVTIEMTGAPATPGDDLMVSIQA